MRVLTAGAVVLGDGAPLPLVAVEQVLVGPAPLHPGELPAEVVAVADRRVHTGGAARGEAVGGVADQKGAGVAEALGELDRIGRGRRGLDHRLEVVRARGLSDRGTDVGRSRRL